MARKPAPSQACCRRLRSLGGQLGAPVLQAEAAAANSRPLADKPDIGVPQAAYDHDRLVEEVTPFIAHSMGPGGAHKPLFPNPEDSVKGWSTVTRGAPPAHLLPPAVLPTVGLTAATWYCDIEADPFVEHPHVRSPTTIQTPLRLDLPALRAIGEAHGTVKIVKAMQCLNVQQPLGQGVWEGVPLATVLRQCGKIANCRRIYYWGYHNEDPAQVFRSSVSYSEAFEPVPNEPPVILAYMLNGKPLPLIRGGPVRLVVPHGYGYKSVKFLQHIRLTNDYRANDTYAAIDEGEEGNDPAAIQKTFTTTDAMIGAEKVRHACLPCYPAPLPISTRVRAHKVREYVRDGSTNTARQCSSVAC